jgi:hypothetical protein
LPGPYAAISQGGAAGGKQTSITYIAEPSTVLLIALAVFSLLEAFDVADL